jgi:hypothetical protein
MHTRTRRKLPDGLRGGLDLDEALRDVGVGEQLSGQGHAVVGGPRSSSSSAGGAKAAPPRTGATWAWLPGSLCDSSTR